MDNHIYDKKQTRIFYTLIFLCWLSYGSLCVARYSFSSSINSLMDFFGRNKDEIGLVSTMNFIAYGVGQVINGLLCKKYNLGYVIGGSLFISALCNIAIFLMPIAGFPYLKFIWMINGFAQSTLWSLIIYTFNTSLPEKFLNRGIVAISTTIATGTFIVYSLSSLFSHLNISKTTFLVAGILAITVSLIVIIFLNKVNKKAIETKKCFENNEKSTEISKSVANGNNNSVWFIFLFAGLCAIINNFVADGVKTWLPTILKELYNIDNSIALLLTMILPVVSIFASFLGIQVHKKIKDFYWLFAFWFTFAFLMILMVVIFLPMHLWGITFVGLFVVGFLMSSTNSAVTSLFPLGIAKGGNAGKIAGVMDGLCYVGSAISAYGLGSVAKNIGWNMVFYIFLIVTILPGIICVIVKIISKIKNRKQI